MAQLAACGGGSDSPASPNPPTPPPPNVGPPASIAVTQGDNQEANPGATVSVPPAVIVRDAANLPVSGISVSFAVDSGGGTVVGGTSQTGTDGIATLGSWRLGPLEGPQVLRVSASTLPAVRLRATARISAATLTPQPLTSGGGTVVVNRPGLPLDGLRVSASSGAFGSATAVQVTVRSPGSVTLPSGLVSQSAGFSISTVNGNQAGPVAVDVPITVPTTKPLFVIAVNDATGGVTVLPTLRRSASRLTVSLPPLGALQFRATSAIRQMPMAPPTRPSVSESGAFLMMVGIDSSLLAGDFDSGFRPETDAWPFSEGLEVYGAREPTGSAFGTAFLDKAPSMTSLWYFLNQRGAGPLATRFIELAPLRLSARMGFRWNGWLELRVPQFYRSYGVRDKAMTDTLPEPPGEEDREEYFGIKALMLLSRNAPVAVQVYDSEFKRDSTFAIGIVWRTEGNAVHVSLPWSADRTFRIELGPTGWRPASIRFGARNRDVTIIGVSAMAVGGGFLDALMAQTWPQVAAGTFGDADGWPRPKLVSKYGPLDTADVVLLDTLQMWWECATCARTAFTQSAVDPHPPALVPFYWTSQPSSGAWLEQFQRNSSFRFSRSSLDNDQQSRRVGVNLVQPGRGAGPGVLDQLGWIDWQTVRFRRLATTLSPDSTRAYPDTTIRLRLETAQPPDSLRYRWILRGATSDSVETGAPELLRTFSTVGKTTVVASVLQGAGKRPIGRDSTVVVIDTLKRGWRITSGSLVSRTPGGVDCNYGPGFYLVALTNEATIKANGRFLWSIEQTLPAELTSPDRPTPGLYLSAVDFPNADTVTSYPAKLATAVPLAHRFNGSFNGERAASGSFTFSSDPFSGTLTGSAVPLVCPGKSQLPVVCSRDYTFSIAATKQGNGLSGTIGFRVIGTNNFFLCESIWQFQAERVR